ncbi:MAG TPA: Sua5/YciO/YrdC/YwlC family protein [Solirubrobacteraceae bacterium]|jgi:L-threonylcarbamoyladenylate synthase|nr:Sua5/YciO/YrdC/YwlC family protein [Solirubrobacteraceae bacterium]
MSLTPADARRLQACLLGDGVALLPTDTVYGLACNPESETAMRRVYELKGRPSLKPAAVMFFALEPAFEVLAEIGPRTRAALGALLPGPVTLLLENPNRRFPLACDSAGVGSGLLGLRVPRFEGPLAALAAVSVPAAQSSANLSGGGDPRDLRNVPLELREDADLVLDGGELPGSASTVVDLAEYERSGGWRIVREGPLGAASVAAALERLA